MTDQSEPIEIEETDDTISLQPLLHQLWVYRRVMGLAIAGIALTVTAILLIGYLVAPKQRLASLGFRLTFEGAERDEFPNGTKFSASEIVSGTVLAPVFKADNVAQYMTPDDFKQAMFVLPANGDVELLSYEYQTKLADSKLTAVDRARLEEEFRKKREALKSAEYSINFARTGHGMSIPDETLQKILQDTLSTWAQQAADRKGAVRYNIPIISRNAVPKEILSGGEPVVVADQLRAKAMRFARVLYGIIDIPGSFAIRTPDGLTLGDIRANIDDLVRLKLEPLIVRLRGTAVKDPIGVQRYFEGRLLQAQLELNEYERRLQGTEEGLRTYLQHGAAGGPETGSGPGAGRDGAVMPQLSESFLDRLVDLAGQSKDMEFRQKLTNRTIDESIAVAESSRQVQFYQSVRSAGTAGSAPPDVGATLESIYGELTRAIDLSDTLYHQISEQNLNPGTVLYSVSSPFVVRTTSALTVQTALFYWVAALLAALLLVPLLCLAFAYSHLVSGRPPVVVVSQK